jgi:hypothetical protein
MPNQTYQSILITGVNHSDDNDHSVEIVQAHARACAMFDEGLVSPLSPIGHNFGQSFCVFPSWSGNTRVGQMNHRENIRTLSEWLAETSLNFVQTKWTEDEPPFVEASHDQAENITQRPSKDATL